MQWSKTKKRLKSLWCEALLDRVDIHATYYRKFHDQPARVWITVDGNERFSAADTQFNMKHEQLYKELRKDLAKMPYSDDFFEMYNSPERLALVNASNVAQNQLHTEGIYDSYYAYEAIMQYPNLTIEQALASENDITLALAMIDRRLGKRKLHQLLKQPCSPLQSKFLMLRCEIEKIGLAQAR